MTNKPKVKLTERDLSIGIEPHKSLDDQMREAWDQVFEDEDRTFTEKMIAAVGGSKTSGAPVFVLSAPTGPNKSVFNRHFRDAFPGHFMVDEAHIPYKPLDRSHLHEHQALAMSWLDNHPAMRMEIDACAGVSFDFETRPYSIGHLPMFVRPLRGTGFGGHVSRDARDADTIEHLRRLRNGIRPWPEESRFEYPSIGGQFKFVHDSVFIEDEYVAPPKAAKDWNKGTAFWHKSAMGGKHNMNLALALFRATKKDYSPEFDWENQYEARRKLAFIKHVNVGTVGHIDWGTNRYKRTRPYWPGYLADCIRTAIKTY